MYNINCLVLYFSYFVALASGSLSLIPKLALPSVNNTMDSTNVLSLNGTSYNN